MAPGFRVREISDEGKVSLPCPGCIIVVHTVGTTVSQQGGLGRTWDWGCLPWCHKIQNNDEHHSLSFGCHVTAGNVAPGTCVRDE